MRPEYAGRVLEWTAQSPVGAAGGGALDKGGSGLFRLGVAARRLPGEGGVDYSGYDWDHRERFCQLLRKTLANSTAGGR